MARRYRRGRGFRRARRSRRIRGIGGIGYGGRGPNRALERMRATQRRTQDRVIAAMVAGGFGVLEKSDMLPENLPALFDDKCHTLALAAAVGSMVTRGKFQRMFDHVANGLVPISAYKIGRDGLDSGGDGLLQGDIFGGAQ